MSAKAAGRKDLIAAFAAALEGETLAATIAKQFRQATLPRISAQHHASFQQEMWHLDLCWANAEGESLPSKLVLKAYPGRFSVWDFSERDLGAVERAASALAAQAGVAVPRAFDVTLGSCNFWMLEWVEGKQPKRTEELEKVGRALAALHRGQCRQNILPALSVHAFLAHLAEKLTACEEIAASKLAIDLAGRIGSSPLSFTHGDPHPGNWLITPSGEPVVLDFEDAACFHPARDLAVIERAAGGEAFNYICAGYIKGGGALPDKWGPWRALLALQDFTIVAYVNFARRSSVSLPAMRLESWAGLKVMSPDEISDLLSRR